MINLKTSKGEFVAMEYNELLVTRNTPKLFDLQTNIHIIDGVKHECIFKLSEAREDNAKLIVDEDVNERQQKALNHVFTERYWKEVKDSFFKDAEPIVFKSIEDKYRVKVFEVERDDDYINKINIKVKLCREYIEKLMEGVK